MSQQPRCAREGQGLVACRKEDFPAPTTMPASFDPEDLALLYVQQFLHERGHAAALKALETSSGVLYDDSKPARGSELLELVYLQLEQQLAAEANGIDANGTSGSADTATIHQHTSALEEERLLSSAAADYPIFVSASLSPGSSNVLCVRLWPGSDLLAVGLADATIKMFRYGSGGNGSGNVVWSTCLPGAGGILTLQLHPQHLAAAATAATAAAGDSGHRHAGVAEQQHGLLLAGAMGGSVHVLQAATGRLLCSAKPHTKYVVAAVWAAAAAAGSGDGSSAAAAVQGEQLIATGSYDSTVCLLKLAWSSGSGEGAGSSGEGSGEGPGAARKAELQLLQQVSFPGYVQDVCFVSAMQPSSSSSSSSRSSCYMPPPPAAAATAAASQQLPPQASSGLQLLVAARGTCSLSILDIPAAFCSPSSNNPGSSGGSSSGGSGSAVLSGSLNLSESDDGHVSFSPMKLALSHCRRLLLVATDSPILVVLRLTGGAVSVLRRLHGLDTDRFHNASLAWHHDGSYVYAGALHAAVFIYHLGSAKCVAKLERQHTVNIRGIDYDPLSKRLATCSFDKTVKVFSHERKLAPGS